MFIKDFITCENFAFRTFGARLSVFELLCEYFWENLGKKEEKKFTFSGF